MPFSKVANWLSPAKLSYACSAHYLEQIDEINLTAEQRGFINEIPDAMFKQTVRDFMVNQQFRRDYWVKGARKLNPLEQLEALRCQRVILVQPRTHVSLKITGAVGEANLQPEIYFPILDALADHQPKSLAQIEQVVIPKGIAFAQLLQAVMVLAGAGSVSAVQDEALITQARKQTDKLNAYLMDKSRGSNDMSFLASPVIGGGFAVSRFQQLFLLAMTQGKKKPDDWAQMVWQTLAEQGQKIVKEGTTLETPEENLAELTVQAEEFAENVLPVIKSLQIV